MSANVWRKCSTCKKDILLNSIYYECSVSTCTGLRTGYVFCSINCWEVHLPGAKHRNAGAIEKKSPQKLEESHSGDNQLKVNITNNPQSTSTVQTAPTSASSSGPTRRIIVNSTSSSPSNSSSMSQEVLVVVSKMKQYIRDISDMNTAEEVNKILSDKIRSECNRAIENARADGRKTVMARDFK